LRGVLARFALLAEAADRFAQTHGKSGDSFQALLAALRQATVILAANFREEELRIAQDSGEWIIHFVAQNFPEGFPAQNILTDTGRPS
jgi:hypothetical protein